MNTYSNQSKKQKKSKILSKFSIEKYIFNRFQRTYFIDELFYGGRVVNDIIYNEKTHIVATFKDYLILDDLSEFLKRYYTTMESEIRLPKFFEYYETYSRIYPNYTSLPESRYIYKNIHKKQKMIDQQQDLEMSMERKKTRQKKEKDNNIQVFSTEVCNSIANDSSYIDLLFGIERRKHYDSNDEDPCYYDSSLERISKIISKIDKYEKIYGISQNTSSGNQKQPIKIMGKIFTNCTKQMSKNSKDLSTISNSTNLFKNMNVNMFNELRLCSNSSVTHNNSQVSSHTHRKTMSSNNSKIKNNPNIFPLTHRCFNQDCLSINGFDKIKVNVNSNSNSNSNNQKFSENERIKSKIKSHHNNNTHNRNHNCLLNSRGQIFSSRTNNNSITNNTNNSIKNATVNNSNGKNNVHQSSKNQINTNNIYKSDRLKTDRPKSTFDFAFLHNLISKSISKSKSKSNNKGGTIGTTTTASSTLNTTRNKNKNINKLNFGTNINGAISSLGKPKKISVNIVNKEEEKYQNDFMNKITSPPQKSIIKGIQIKNFNKVLGIQNYFSPKVKIANGKNEYMNINNINQNKLIDKNNINLKSTSKRKIPAQTMRVVYKTKI